MIRKPQKYDETQVTEPQEKLPIGGYVLKILGVKVEDYSWGQVLVLRHDIAEGEHVGFFKKNYDAQESNQKWKGTFRINLPKDDGSEMDQWNVRRLKAAMIAIEKSNDGYVWNWDENSLVGKFVGGLFGNKEYEYNGSRGFYTECRTLCSTERIRSGNFTIPKDKMLENKTSSNDMAIPAGFFAVDDEDIPF